MPIKKQQKNNHISEQQQDSVYPQSREDSQYKIYEKAYLSQLSQNEQDIVNQYLQDSQKKTKRQLVTQREDLMQDLHQINQHLSEMINHLEGTLFNLSKNNNKKQNSISSPNKHSKISKKHAIDKDSNQESRYKNKLRQRDELANLTSNQLDIMQQKNQKLMISLQQQIQDYQFMLTGEYWDRLDQQIEKQTSYKKQIQQQISYLKKSVQKHTKSYDKEVISRLQKSSYDKQVELTLLSKKLQLKQIKLESIENQTKQKINKIKQLQHEEISLSNMLEMYQDDEYEGIQSGRRRKEKQQKLSIKKAKLQKVINSLNTNNLKYYNKKLSEFRQLSNRIIELDEVVKQIDYNIVLIVKERKDFQERNQNILQRSTIIPTLRQEIAQIKSQQKISDSREKFNPQNSSYTGKPRLKTVSQHVHAFIPKRQATEFETSQNEILNQSFQNKIQPDDSTYLKRRVYTELQNNHYFSSLAKNPQNSNSPIQQYVRPKQQLTDRQDYNTKNIFRQKKFNSGVSNISFNNQPKVPQMQQKQKKYVKSQRSSNSFERQRKKTDQIQERLKKLEVFLRNQQTNLSTLSKIQEKLYSSKRKKISAYENEAYESEPLKVSSSKLKSDLNLRPKQKHYKELCDRLGKNKLLIEQQCDISDLIYRGMTGKIDS